MDQKIADLTARRQRRGQQRLDRCGCGRLARMVFGGAGGVSNPVIARPCNGRDRPVEHHPLVKRLDVEHLWLTVAG
ncbi:MAG TPA: hypothetical protein VLJ88_03270 [Propionibacteriaceae bacterium]|nr:hypothetical protein [Propionibacteriaceae bacterium]